MKETQGQRRPQMCLATGKTEAKLEPRKGGCFYEVGVRRLASIRLRLPATTKRLRLAELFGTQPRYLGRMGTRSSMCLVQQRRSNKSPAEKRKQRIDIEIDPRCDLGSPVVALSVTQFDTWNDDTSANWCCRFRAEFAPYCQSCARPSVSRQSAVLRWRGQLKAECLDEQYCT